MKLNETSLLYSNGLFEFIYLFNLKSNIKRRTLYTFVINNKKLCISYSMYSNK